MITENLIRVAAQASAAIDFNSLGLSPIIFNIGPLPIRWYSLGYLAGIIVGWWYLLKLLGQPGAPMARRHADDMVFYATLGIILGGRLGYVLFYRPGFYLEQPGEILRLWDGGMSFHGGMIGTSLGILYLSWKEKLSWLRIHDYVACCVPFGLGFVRLANFVNAELWGKETNVPWAVIFPAASDPLRLARHPSQIYEAILEGILLFVLLFWAFWKTDARYQPGKLVGLFLLGYGVSRFFVEFFREADAQLMEFARVTHLHMGQWLSLPMIVGGLYLIATAKRRRQRVEPIAGTESVA